MGKKKRPVQRGKGVKNAKGKKSRSGATAKAVGHEQERAVVHVSGGMGAREENKREQADLVARHVCDYVCRHPPLLPSLACFVILYFPVSRSFFLFPSCLLSILFPLWTRFELFVLTCLVSIFFESLVCIIVPWPSQNILYPC